MKTIKELKKGCGEWSANEGFDSCGEQKMLCDICKLKIQTLKEVLKLIEKEIEYCKSKLTETFEGDKSWNWRLVGYQELIKQIEGK